MVSGFASCKNSFYINPRYDVISVFVGFLSRILGKKELSKETATTECYSNNPEELLCVFETEELAVVETVH